jgi:hypothetical protein
MQLHPLLGKVQGKKIIGLLGGDDPSKPATTKVPVAKTQAEVDAVNKEAKRFALARPTLISGEDTYAVRKVGDPLPQYIDSRTGKPYIPFPAKPRAMTVPNSVMREDIKTDGHGNHWYEDPQTGDVVDIDPSVFNLPRFRKTKEENEANLKARAEKGVVKR